MTQHFYEDHKKTIRGILAFVVMTIAGFIFINDASAIQIEGCNSYLGPCWCDSGNSCGVVWANSNAGGDTSDTIEVVAGLGGYKPSHVTGYIHGAVYNMAVPPDAGKPNAAHHVFFIDRDWDCSTDPDTSDGCQGYTYWDDQSSAWANAWSVNYISQRNGYFSRGTVSNFAGDWWNESAWSSGWQGSSMQVTINANDFIGGSWVENIEEWEDGDTLWTKTTYARRVNVFRCYYDHRGCSSTEHTIKLVFLEPFNEPQRYNVYFDGKVSLNNDGGSPLFRDGDPFNNATWCRYGTTICAGWEDNYLPYVTLDLYTPKKSGQRLTSTFRLKYTGNGWEGNPDMKQYSELYSPHYVYNSDGDLVRIEYWKTTYSFRSGLTNTSGSGAFDYNTRGFPFGFEDDITSSKSKTLSIPYGTDLNFTETMGYNHTSNTARCRHVKKAIKGSGPPVAYEEYDECRWSGSGSDHRDRRIITTIHNPFNFETSARASFANGNGSTVLGGSVVNLRFDVNLVPKLNDKINEYPYYTEVPDNTKVTAASFVIKQDVPEDQISKLSDQMKEHKEYNLGIDSNLCQFATRVFGDAMVSEKDGMIGANACNVLFTKNASQINNDLVNVGEKITNGKGASTIPNESTYPVVIPDLDDGYKYCTVVGINHTNSGGGYMSNMNNNWHVSNVSCRTIARVPNFQTWGNIYTSANIDTVTVKKVFEPDNANAVNIKTDPARAQSYLFGSWSETFTLANRDIYDFSTGAAVGYNSDSKGGLPVSNNAGYCDIINLSISNKQCKDDNSRSGNAGNVVVNNEDFISRFVSHYATTNTGSLDQVTEDVKYYRAGGNATINDTNALKDNGYILGNGVLSILNGTLIYQVDGDLTINHNICTGYPKPDGQCNNGSTEDIVRLLTNLDNSNQRYAAGDKIPQIIIIASGDVKIDPSVTEIDAWIYSGKSIKTCYTNNDNQWYLTCNNPLIVHGPVFAKKLELRRTYGAYGGRAWSGNFTNKSSYLFSGATTSAEIFDLRSDVYQWIYQQIGGSDDATNVRYIRELAPRY